MKKKLTILFSLIINAVIIMASIHNIYSCLFKTSSGILQPLGFTCFRFYTIDSNIFLSITSLIVIVAILKEKNLSHKMFMLRYYSVVTIMITFSTVLLFLGPLYGYKAMYIGDNLFAHFISPLLGLISFLFIEKGKFRNNEYLKAVIPTIIYGIIYIIMAVILKKWPDFYGFNRNNMMPVTAIVMIVAVTSLSVIIKKIYSVLNK